MFERDWEPAEATVIAVKELSNWTGDPDSSVTQSPPHEYVVDVRPADQPPFRATFRDPYIRGHRDHPQEGQVVNVLYQPKSHKVKLIADEWTYSAGKSKDEKQTEDERFRAARDAPAGGAAPPVQTESHVVRFVDSDRVLRSDRVVSSDLGVPAADQLAKLADLHDRGVLSDAEFAAEKAKVLAQE